MHSSPLLFLAHPCRAVSSFVCKIIEKSLGYETAIVGSWAQKTYLPDSDIDLTVFHVGHTNWYTRLTDALINRAIEDREGEGQNSYDLACALNPVRR